MSFGRIIAWLVGFAVVMGAYKKFGHHEEGMAGFLPGSKPDINKQLEKFAEVENKNCPRMLNAMVQADGVSVDDHLINYSATLVKVNKDVINTRDMEERFKPETLRAYCHDPKVKPFIDNGVTARFSFKDSSSRDLMTITIYPNECRGAV